MPPTQNTAASRWMVSSNMIRRIVAPLVSADRLAGAYSPMQAPASPFSAASLRLSSNMTMGARPMNLGVAGLGRMGAAIAQRLMEVGHKVAVWNRSVDKASPLAALGATVAAT